MKSGRRLSTKNILAKGEAMMTDMTDAAWIRATIEVVDNDLKNEFENSAIVHQSDNAHTHIFTLDNGKKRFALMIGWPVFAERRLTQAKISRGLKQENVAEEMRLHGADGYHWTPSTVEMPQIGDR